MGTLEISKNQTKISKIQKWRHPKKPISRAVFEHVATHRSAIFIGANDAGVRDLLIAPIKTGSWYGATCSKSALESAQKRLVSSSTCSNFAI